MKALQKLSQKILNCILAISMFLTTGITTVFADEEITYDTMKASVVSLSSSIDELSTKTVTDADNINSAIQKVVDSLEDVKSGEVSVYVNDKVVVKILDSITYSKDDLTEDNKTKYNKGAQELTTIYKNAVDEISLLINIINDAKNLDTSINVLEEDVKNKLNNIASIIEVESKLYTEKVSELNTLVLDLTLYNSKINNNMVRNNLEKLKVEAEKLKVDATSAELDTLITNIIDELSEEFIDEDDYNSFKEEYDKLLNEFINNSTDAVIEKLLAIDPEMEDSEKELVIDELKSNLSLLEKYESDLNTFNTKIEDKLNELKIPTNDEEKQSGLTIINKLDLLKDKYSDENKTLLENKFILFQKNTNANIETLKIHGFVFEKEVIESGDLNLYVANDVINPTVEVTTEDVNATYEIFNNTNLVEGKNEVTIIVTAENGNTKTYTVNVYRMEKDAETGDVQTKEETTGTPAVENVEEKEETTVTTLTTNKTSNSTVNNNTNEEKEEKKSNTSDVKDKYNEELEEEGMNPLTILLVVAGIALVGFGIYMLFGKDDDDIVAKKPKKEEKVEIKKVEIKKNNKKSTNKKNNSKKK